MKTIIKPIESIASQKDAKIIIIFCACFILLIFSLDAQVKIGDNPNTINANSLLELESTNKGLLPPRVTLQNVDSVTPLTAPVPAGMLVYNNGGALAVGYYAWNGTKWVGTMGNQPNGCFSSSVSQFVSSTTTAKVIAYETDEIINQVTHSTTVNPSRVTVQVTGTYLVTFSAQLHGASADIDIWLRQNGADVARTNSRSSLQNSGDYRILTVTFIVPAVVNDYFELVQSSTNISAGLFAVSAGTNPTRPSIPSIIITINKISD